MNNSEMEFVGQVVPELPEAHLRTQISQQRQEDGLRVEKTKESPVARRSGEWCGNKFEKIGMCMGLFGLLAVGEPLAVGLYGREFYGNTDHFNTVGDRVAEALEIPVIKKNNVMNEARSCETLLGYFAAVVGWGLMRASSIKRAGVKMGNFDFEK